MIDPNCGGAIARGDVHAHQEPVSFLSQGIIAKQFPTDTSRFGVVAVGGQDLGQSQQMRQVLVAESLAHVEHPLVVAPLQQVTAIEVDCGAEGFEFVTCRDSRCIGCGLSSVERGDVDPARRGLPPPQRLSRHLEELIQLGARLPQRVNQMAQVRERLTFIGVGPKHESKTMSRLRSVAMQEKERKERPCPGRFKPGETLVAEAQLQLAEQPNRERRRGIIRIDRSVHRFSLALRSFRGIRTSGPVARAVEGMQNAAR